MANNTLLESTIEAVKFYTKDEKKIIRKNLIKNGIIASSNEDKEVNILTIIQELLRSNDKIIKDIEQWEFDKAYKYSIYYDIENIDPERIKELIEKGKIFDYDNHTDQYETQHLRISEVSVPSLKMLDEKYIFKFNVRLRRYEADNVEISVRYPICVIMDIEKKFAEVRFDSYPGLYGGDKLEYVDSVTSWFFDNLRIYLRDIDLYPTIKPIIVNKDSVVEKYRNKISIIWQDMKTNKGGKATVGCNKDGKLPFVGELNDFLLENESEFLKVPVLKSKFERFIEQHIKLSEYPSVRLAYSELKGLDTKMAFYYEKHNYTLVQHYAYTTQESVKKERMEYVSDFIFDNRESYKKQKTEQSADSKTN